MHLNIDRVASADVDPESFNRAEAADRRRSEGLINRVFSVPTAKVVSRPEQLFLR